MRRSRAGRRAAGRSSRRASSRGRRDRLSRSGECPRHCRSTVRRNSPFIRPVTTHVALVAAIECMLEGVRHKLVDDDGDRDRHLGAGRDLFHLAADVHVLTRQAAFDLLAKTAEVVIQPDALQIAAAERESLRRLGDRLDPVGHLVQRFLHAVVCRSLCLQVDHREHGLVIVARSVVDLIQGMVEQGQSLLPLGNALVDLSLIERDDEQHEQLRDRRNRQADRFARYRAIAKL